MCCEGSLLLCVCVCVWLLVCLPSLIISSLKRLEKKKPIYYFCFSYLCECFIFRSLVFSSFPVSVPFSFLLPLSMFPPLHFSPPPWCSSSSLSPSSSPSRRPRGHRPCGLEEDVRQYEQDLAKRLYQARVRASQGTAEAPQPPTSSSTSSSAASQLRSAPRPRPPGPDARHHGGCAGVLCRWYFC